MSSFSSSKSFHFRHNNNRSCSPEEEREKEGDQRMCQSSDKPNMAIEAPHRTHSNDTDEDCSNSFQDTITSNCSSNKLHQEDSPSIHSGKRNDDNNPISDDGDVHFFEGDDGDSSTNNEFKDSVSKMKIKHGHHRSLSGLFSENASISAPVADRSKEEMTTDDLKHNGNDDTTSTTSYPCQQLRSSSSSSVKAMDSMHGSYSMKRDASTSSGKKHRRIYSGGVSNPSMAHRRINSGGNAAFISRNTLTNAMNGSEGRQAAAYGSNRIVKHPPMQNYYPYAQQHSFNFGRSSRSLSPTPSPKCYSNNDVKQNHHYKDDSEIRNYSYQQHPSSRYHKNHTMAMDTNTVNTASETKPGVGLSDGDEKIAAAQWLQHFRKSPPLDLDPVSYVDNPSPSQMFPSGNATSAYHPPDSHHPPSRHSFPPPSKPSSVKNFSRSSSVTTASRNGSPLQSFYDSDFKYSPFDFGEKSSSPPMPPMFRQPSSASMAPVPPSVHHHYQYPTQQLQSNHSNSRSYHDGPMSQFPRRLKPPSSHDYSYYPKPSGANSRKLSTCGSTYPAQRQNQHPFYHHQPSTNQHYHQSSSSYVAATHAARDAALGLPPHPLAMEARPTQRQHKSTTSMESQIETDELLFYKDGLQQATNTKSHPISLSASSTAPPARDGYNSYPPKPPSNEEPHYRISPQLFQETLNDLPHNNGSDVDERSPTSLPLSNSYQESLLSSLVGNNTHSLSQKQQNEQNRHDGNGAGNGAGNGERSHHHRNSSIAILHTLINDTNDTQPKPHQRVNSIDSIGTLDDGLLGEKFLGMQPEQIVQPILSNPSVQQTSIAQSDTEKSTMLKSTRVSVRSRENQASVKARSISASYDQGTIEEKSTKPNTGRKITGSVSKRVRRKCNMEGCSNRVVQGGLCIAHGAKRKKCGFPGCTKNVKKAGMCSAHGPARKRCEIEGCQKVAVQGGKCVAHGAKKKLCKVDNCKKQAILSGMCKRHHDMNTTGKLDFPPSDMSGDYCQHVSSHNSFFAKENEGNSPGNDEVDRSNSAPSKASHKRGLSIFQEMSAVETIIGSSTESAAYSTGDTASRSNANASSSRGGKSTHNRGLSIFAEDEVMDKIVQNKIGI